MSNFSKHANKKKHEVCMYLFQTSENFHLLKKALHFLEKHLKVNGLIHKLKKLDL